MLLQPVCQRHLVATVERRPPQAPPDERHGGASTMPAEIRIHAEARLVSVDEGVRPVVVWIELRACDRLVKFLHEPALTRARLTKDDRELRPWRPIAIFASDCVQPGFPEGGLFLLPTDEHVLPAHRQCGGTIRIRLHDFPSRRPVSRTQVSGDHTGFPFALRRVRAAVGRAGGRDGLGTARLTRSPYMAPIQVRAMEGVTVSRECCHLELRAIAACSHHGKGTNTLRRPRQSCWDPG